MTSLTFFFIFIPILSLILLMVNILLSPHNPYQEKNSAFECGFHSFLGQNRTQFSISFFIFALLFLLFITSAYTRFLNTFKNLSFLFNLENLMFFYQFQFAYKYLI